MEYVAAILLGYAIGVLISMVITAIRRPVRGTGGHEIEPPIREKPSADEPNTRRAPPA